MKCRDCDAEVQVTDHPRKDGKHVTRMARCPNGHKRVLSKKDLEPLPAPEPAAEPKKNQGRSILDDFIDFITGE